MLRFDIDLRSCFIFVLNNNNLKNYTLKYISCLLLLTVTLGSFADQPDSLFYYRGIVKSLQGNYPVAFAHIINLQQRKGIVADTSGYFEIWVSEKDTLNISAIGFEYKEYPVKYKGDILDTIILKNRTYLQELINLSTPFHF